MAGNNPRCSFDELGRLRARAAHGCREFDGNAGPDPLNPANIQRFGAWHGCCFSYMQVTVNEVFQC